MGGGHHEGDDGTNAAMEVDVLKSGDTTAIEETVNKNNLGGGHHEGDDGTNAAMEVDDATALKGDDSTTQGNIIVMQTIIVIVIVIYQ